MRPDAEKVSSIKDKQLTWPMVVGCTIGAVCSLYIFLVGLALMGSSAKVLGGRGASSMFSSIENPIAGLMVGVLATILVQSSSTSTSIVVAMTGAGTLGVKTGIPIIMGANIGTSVTNTLVSMGQVTNRIDLERAFSGATVHDMFNMLTVVTLLPIEATIGAIQGEGGPLYWLTYSITEAITGGEGGEPLFESPVKTVTAPFANAILKSNKYVIYALTLPKPEAITPKAVNTTLCDTNRRLDDNEQIGAHSTEASRSLLSRRLEEKVDCSQYWCISKAMDKNFKKISSSSYAKLTKCGNMVLDRGGDPCDGGACYLDAGAYYEKRVEKGALLKGGFLAAAGDEAGGIIGLFISILLLCGGLLGLVALLKIVFLSKAKRVLREATKLNDYAAMLIGLGITIIVQSSSVTTSALTPLCGMGVLPLEKMLPLTLGANIGTTCTALIASLVSLKFEAVQIALCHLCFNLVGIAIWFPAPFMRRYPLLAARTLGLYTSVYRTFPLVYIVVVFVMVPGACLAISAIYGYSVAGGFIVTLLAMVALGAFEFLWWVGYPVGNPLCYKVLSLEQREASAVELESAQKAIAQEEVPVAQGGEAAFEDAAPAQGEKTALEETVPEKATTGPTMV